jgi:FkbM family methyltransferase
MVAPAQLSKNDRAERAGECVAGMNPLSGVDSNTAMENLLDIIGYLGVYRTARQLRNRYLRPDLENRFKTLRQFYTQFIRPGDLVFDIGANRGDRTEVFVRMGARVVAAEPQPFLAARLRAIFRYSEVSVEPVGVGSAHGTLPLHLCSVDSVSSFSQEFIHNRSKENFSRQWDRVEMVPVVTADSLIQKHGLPVFLKIDVEGFEGEVFAGLTQPVKNLSFEVHPDDSPGSLADCLKRLDQLSNYEFNLALEEELQFELPQWVDSGRLLKAMREIPESKWTYGDIYARRSDARSN